MSVSCKRWVSCNLKARLAKLWILLLLDHGRECGDAALRSSVHVHEHKLTTLSAVNTVFVSPHSPFPAQPQTNSTKNSIVTSPKGNIPSPALVFTSSTPFGSSVSVFASADPPPPVPPFPQCSPPSPVVCSSVCLCCGLSLIFVSLPRY